MQMTRVIERSFHLESPSERDEWVQAYEQVKKALDGSRASVADTENRMRAMSFMEKGAPKPCDIGEPIALLKLPQPCFPKLGPPSEGGTRLTE